MHNIRYKFTAIAIIWVGLLFSYSVYADAWLDGTPIFHEEALFLAEMIGHDDSVMLAPAIAGNSSPPAYKVGDQRNYYAVNVLTNSQYSLTASLYGVSDKAYVFLEDGRSISTNKITALLNAFDRIYDNITGPFGPPPDTIDGDPRIHILLMDIAGGLQADGSRVIGYFSPINQYRNNQLPRWTKRRSNEVEMLYIDYRALLSTKQEVMESVIAHEFTHLIQWVWDPGESIWINEGIAIYAESMLGYEVESRISAFENEPDTPLMEWSGVLSDYGAAYLFFEYISERFGGAPAIAAILKAREQGAEGIELALEKNGNPVSFHELFSDWVIANYLDDPDLENGIYGYTSLDIHLKPSVVEFQYPIDHKASRLKPWTALYIEFRKGKDDSLELSVQEDERSDDIVAQIIEIGDNTRISNIKTADSDSGSVLIPQENSKNILVVTSQPEPPELRKTYSTYDYSAETKMSEVSVEPISNNKITTWGRIRRD